MIEIQEKVRNFKKGVKALTEMRRITIALPDEIDRRILEMRKDDRFVRCSYAEIVRQLLEKGLAEEADKPAS